MPPADESRSAQGDTSSDTPDGPPTDSEQIVPGPAERPPAEEPVDDQAAMAATGVGQAPVFDSDEGDEIRRPASASSPSAADAPAAPPLVPGEPDLYDYEPEPDEEEVGEGGGKMSFLEHLDELRRRLLISTAALLGGFR